MSWLSQFLHSVGNGALDKEPVTHGDQTPVHAALDRINASGAALSASLTSAAKSTLDGYLTTKIGQVAASVTDAALQAIIDEAYSRMWSRRSPTRLETTQVEQNDVSPRLGS